MFARAISAIVDFAARKGLAEAGAEHSSEIPTKQNRNESARRTGVRGETYAYGICDGMDTCSWRGTIRCRE